MALAICGGVTVGVAQIAVSLQAIGLNATAAQIGLIGGLPNVGVLATVLPMGFLVDRHGPRRMFTLGALASAVGYLCMARASSADTLLVAVTVAALFLSARFVSLNTVFLDYLRGAGNARAGWYRGSHSIGMLFVGPLLGSHLVQRIGCGPTFLVVSALLLVTLALAALVLAPRGAPTTSPASPDEGVLESVWSLVRNEEVLEASIFESVAVMAMSTFTAFMPLIAVREFLLSTQEAAALIATQGAVFIAVLFSMESVLRRFGRRRFYLLSCGLAVVGLTILAAADTAVLLWSGTAFLGGGLGMLNIVNVARLSGVDVRKGRVSGVFSLFTITGAIVGPMLGGVLGKSFRPQVVFLAFVPAFALVAHRVWAGGRHRRAGAVTAWRPEGILPSDVDGAPVAPEES